MARRPAASQRHAAAVPLGFPLLLAVSCCLQAEAFAFGGQQTAVCGCLSHAGSRVLQPVSAAAPPLATSSRQQAFAAGLEAAGDAGGEAGGQMMLAERSVNRVTLVGRVGLEPEVRLLPTGDRMATFSLATSEQWRDKNSGEVRSRTEWHRVVIFDKHLVDLVEAFVHKGRRLFVEGSLQTRRWVASDGQERYTTEVLLSKYKGELVLLESPQQDNRLNGPTTTPPGGRTAAESAAPQQGLRGVGIGAAAASGGQQQTSAAAAGRAANGQDNNAPVPFRQSALWR